MSRSIWDLPIDELGPAIRTRKISPIALTEACLDRIGRHDDKLSSFICLAGDALDQARNAERDLKSGKPLGPLHGIPLAIKDNYLTADMPTTKSSSS